MNGIGDAVLALPALRALSTLCHGELSVVTSRSGGTHVFDALQLRKLVRVRRWRDEGRIAFDVEEAVERVGPARRLVSLVPWVSPDLRRFVRMVGASLSIGFHDAFDIVLPRNFEKHSADLALDAVRALWPAVRMADFVQEPLAFDQHAKEFVGSVRASLPAGSRLVAVHCDTLEEKMWPIDRFNELVTRVLGDNRDVYVVQVGSSRCGLEAAEHGDRLICAVGLPLQDSQCLVAAADLFVGVDSSMLHVADLCRVPSVGLFGPTDANEFGFLIGPNKTLQGQGRMLDISCEQVYEAVSAMLPSRAVHQAGVVTEARACRSTS